jgi:hypothetical protein
MRNSVIRKKRLKAERIVDDYLRMPQRSITGVPNLDAAQAWNQSTGRLFVIDDEPRIGFVPGIRRSAVTNRYVTAGKG